MRPDLTPRDLIMTARHGAFEPWWHVYDDADRQRAEHLAVTLGLGEHLDQPFGTLSAGERRRTSIARALMPDPDVLFLDEPTASLDLAARETLLRDLSRLAAAARPTAIILVSHHLEEIYEVCRSVTVLRDGRVVANAPLAVQASQLRRVEVSRHARAAIQAVVRVRDTAVEDVRYAAIPGVLVSAVAGQTVLAPLLGDQRPGADYLVW